MDDVFLVERNPSVEAKVKEKIRSVSLITRTIRVGRVTWFTLYTTARCSIGSLSMCVPPREEAEAALHQHARTPGFTPTRFTCLANRTVEVTNKPRCSPTVVRGVRESTRPTNSRGVVVASPRGNKGLGIGAASGLLYRPRGVDYATRPRP